MTTERAPPDGVALAEAQPHRRRGSHMASAAATCSSGRGVSSAAGVLAGQLPPSAPAPSRRSGSRTSGRFPAAWRGDRILPIKINGDERNLYVSSTLDDATGEMIAKFVNAAGKDLFAKKCASCHGAAGEGKESIAKMFQVEMKPLTSKDIQAKSDSDLKKVILEGSGKMKPVKDLDAKNADDIVAYLRILGKK